MMFYYSHGYGSTTLSQASWHYIPHNLTMSQQHKKTICLQKSLKMLVLYTKGLNKVQNGAELHIQPRHIYLFLLSTEPQPISNASFQLQVQTLCTSKEIKFTSSDTRLNIIESQDLFLQAVRKTKYQISRRRVFSSGMLCGNYLTSSVESSICATTCSNAASLVNSPAAPLHSRQLTHGLRRFIRW